MVIKDTENVQVQHFPLHYLGFSSCKHLLYSFLKIPVLSCAMTNGCCASPSSGCGSAANGSESPQSAPLGLAGDTSGPKPSDKTLIQQNSQAKHNLMPVADIKYVKNSHIYTPCPFIFGGLGQVYDVAPEELLLRVSVHEGCRVRCLRHAQQETTPSTWHPWAQCLARGSGSRQSLQAKNQQG